MSQMINGLLFAWNKNMEYGPKLIADLEPSQMVGQPSSDPDAPANHPAWVFSHLNAYLPVIESIIKGEPFDDPKDHPFGMLSAPTSNADDYANKQTLLNTFTTGHESIKHLLENSDDSVFEQAVELPRWKSVMPTAGIALPYLMLNHENGHLGQLSAWRRIQGMPRV